MVTIVMKVKVNYKSGLCRTLVRFRDPVSR